MIDDIIYCNKINLSENVEIRPVWKKNYKTLNESRSFCLRLNANPGQISKDAGFVYESLRIETNRVIWDFGSHETNPRNEYFKNESTKRIHDTNL